MGREGAGVRRYRHFKGAEYEEIGVVTHTETGEHFMAYRSVPSGELWIRPLAQFCEYVNVDGQWVPRFERIQEAA